MKPDIIHKAAAFAAKAHAGQFRDNGVTPFILHPAKVSMILSVVCPDDPELIAAAWLHDTVEDTDTTFAQLLDEFGPEVMKLVAEVTHIKPADGPAYFPNLKTRRGAILKFADRLSNLADMDGWDEKRQDKYIAKSTFWKNKPDNIIQP